jgi:NAD(P)H-hydrate epimerase
LGATVQEVQGDRLAAVRKLADQYQAVVILKGAGTLVCEPGSVPWLNLTGNPGMASGGMGDVLAGMVGALWAQGMGAVQAASTAVWVHGTAGDYAALAESQTSLSATALAAQLGRVFQTIERRPV